MSPLRNGEELLDERVLADRRSGHTGATSQHLISDQENEAVENVASRDQLSTADHLDERTNGPCATDALQHASANRKTDGTAAHDTSHQVRQRTSGELCSVPEKVSSALNVSNHPPLTATHGPTLGEKTGPQDQADRDAFPEGGLRAWLVVFGSFTYVFSEFMFPLLNPILSLETYLRSIYPLDVFSSPLHPLKQARLTPKR